jgi:hypothetical protein
MLLQVNLEILKLKMVFTIVSGKKAGNAISADALRQLQAVFSVKDTITKKEARDIGVMSGATLTQVILNVSCFFMFCVHCSFLLLQCMPNSLDIVSYLCKDRHSPYRQRLECEQLGSVQVLVFVVYDDDVNIGFCHLLTNY